MPPLGPGMILALAPKLIAANDRAIVELDTRDVLFPASRRLDGEMGQKTATI